MKAIIKTIKTFYIKNVLNSLEQKYTVPDLEKFKKQKIEDYLVLCKTKGIKPSYREEKDKLVFYHGADRTSNRHEVIFIFMPQQ